MREVIVEAAWKAFRESTKPAPYNQMRDAVDAAIEAHKQQLSEAGFVIVPKVMEWLPIETAPKDCDFLAYEDGFFYVGSMGWEENGVPVWWNGDHRIEPTHWMPLPNPPAPHNTDATKP